MIYARRFFQRTRTADAGQSARKKTTLATLGRLLGLIAVFTSSAAQAANCSAPAIAAAQPVDRDTLKVSRIAGAHSGVQDSWDMRYDAWFCNPNATGYKVSMVKIEHLNGSTPIRAATLALGTTVAAGATEQLVLVRDNAQYPFPLPTGVRLTFSLATPAGRYLGKITEYHRVAEHINPGPLTAYFFPMKQSDLPPGGYWMQKRHAQDNTYQRWAYDLTVQVWDKFFWRTTKPDTDGTHKEDSYTYNRPVYAMSDGLVIGCNRGGPDNDPAEKNGNVAGGNLLWVRTGNETTLYAHLRQYSIPRNLCPFDDDQQHQVGDPNQNLASNAQYRIRAGQLIGYTGNSGFSRKGGSHLHIHTFMGLPGIWGGTETGVDADARPLEFVNVRVQEAAPINVIASRWNALATRKLLPYYTRIMPNDCGYSASAVVGKAEVLNPGVSASCFTQMYNAMVQAGDRPVHIDLHGVGSSSNSTSIWRPSDGTPWGLFLGLNDRDFEYTRNDWVNKKGFRILQLEAYAEAGALKHAMILTKDSNAVQFSRANMNAATWQSEFNAQTAQGFVPVNVSAATVGGSLRIDALMEKWNMGRFASKANIPIADYQAEYDAQKAAHNSLTYIDGYEYNGSAFVSALWHGGLTGGCSAAHGQRRFQILASETQNLAAGCFARSVAEYTNGGLRYAGVWRHAPNTVLTGGPSGEIASDAAVFSFSSNDPMTTFECRLDSGSWAACKSPKQYVLLGQSTHTFQVRARDRQGLRDDTPATRSWTVL